MGDQYLDRTVREVCARFSIGEPVSVSNAGGTRNVSFIVDTDQGKWVVRRRFAGYCDPDWIEFDHSAARYLADRGVPVVPPRIAPDGSTFASIGGDTWEVHPFVTGRHLRDGYRSDVIALARSLGRFHLAGSSFAGRCDKLGPRGETDPDHLLRSIERARRDCPETGAVLDVHRQTVLESAESLTAETYDSLPCTIVHGDVQPANIIMAEAGVRAFIDMDWMAWRPRVYDLCFALLCCVASHDRPIGQGDVWDLTQSPVSDDDMKRKFLEEYQRTSGPLTSAEEAALEPQMELTWCHIRVDNCLKVPRERRLEFLQR